MKRPSATPVMRLSLSIAILASLTLHVQAQAPNIAGRWAVTWDADVRIDHDTAVVKSRKPASLELTQRGDSVFGVWGAGPDGGIQLRGTFNGRTVRLTSGVNERTGMVDGKPVQMKVRWDIAGALDNSKLAGTLMLYLGTLPAVPRRWDAQRAP
jgi:hypothetical protein